MKLRTISFLVLTFLSGPLVVDAAAQPPFGKKRPGKKRAGLRPGEINTPAARSERVKTQLKKGDPAPDFALPMLTGDRVIRLSAFRGKKPVVLVFASYT
jgi:hypothetical protein